MNPATSSRGHRWVLLVLAGVLCWPAVQALSVTESSARGVVRASQPLVQTELAAHGLPASGVAGAAQGVPSVLGLSCEQARRVLARQHLQLRSCIVGAAQDGYGAGLINRQFPAPGQALPKTAPVVDAWMQPVVVRLPAARVPLAQVPPVRVPPAVVGRLLQVPALFGLSCADARVAAHRAGWPELDCSEADGGEEAIPDVVFRQMPPAGTLLKQVEPLRVVVHVPPLVSMPDVRGQALEDARVRLEQARFKVSVQGPNAQEGVLVHAQEPEPGRLLLRGSLVRVVSQLTVPDLTGASCEDARALLHLHGLPDTHCEERLPEPGLSVPPQGWHSGRVFQQQPLAGLRLDAGQPVTLTVVGRPAVPDVRGLSVDRAVTALGSAGLQADVAQDAQGPDFDVAAQEPPAGTQVDWLSRVRLNAVRMVLVPDLGTLSCAAADVVVRPQQFRLECVVSDPGLKWRDPTIARQQPPAGARAPAGSVIRAEARGARLPGWAAVVGAAGALAAAGAYFGFRRRQAAINRPQAQVPATRLPKVSLRGVPDDHPKVLIQAESEKDEAPDRSVYEWRAEVGARQMYVQIQQPAQEENNVQH